MIVFPIVGLWFRPVNFSVIEAKCVYGKCLIFWTPVACWKSQDKQHRPRSDCFWTSSLIRVFPVCYYDKHYANSSPENQHFIWDKKEKNVCNFRTFTVNFLNSNEKVVLKLSHQYRVKHFQLLFVMLILNDYRFIYMQILSISRPTVRIPLISSIYHGNGLCRFSYIIILVQLKNWYSI